VKRQVLFGVAVAVFLWTLVTQAPASLVYRWIGPHMPSLRLFGVDGRLADGSASGFAIGDRNIDERLGWSLQPWWLPLGRVAAHVTGSGALQAEGSLQFGLGGLRLRSLHGSGDAKAIAGLVGYGFAPLAGAAQFDIASLQLKGNRPLAAEADVQLHGLAWALTQNPVPLGDFRATATTQADSILVKIVSLSGPLDADGDVKYTTADGRYEVQLKLKPKDNAEPALKNMLQSLGAPDSGGAYHLHQDGTLQGNL